VRLALAPSPGLAALVLLLHGAAAVAMLTAMTGVLAGVLALLIVALGAGAARDRALLRGSASPQAIEIRASGQAYCVLRDGSALPIERESAAVRRFWVALPLKSRRRRTFLVPSGMLSVESFRFLRLWALWGKLPGVASRQLSGRS
jgi:hypothetical protein